MICLPSRDLSMKDAVSRAFLHKKLDSGTRVLMGNTGQEDICDARKTDSKLGEEMKDSGLGGGTGRGISVTLICGCSGTEVEIV